MRIDHIVDERMDPFIATGAAGQLLKYNHSILNSWPLALTAYNHGVAGMRRAVRKLGSDDIAQIAERYKGRTFGFASRNFYVAFLAALEVQNNAEHYFGTLKLETPSDDVLIKVPDYMTPQTIAAALEVKTELLRMHNPALQATVWRGTKYLPRGFTLRVPRAGLPDGHAEKFAAIPAAERYAAQLLDLFHTVGRGETLSQMAQRYETSQSELVALNGLRSRHRIRAGQVLRLPAAGAVVAAGGSYIVRSGDTLAKVAKRFAVSEGDLMRLNGISDQNRIYAGQQLVLTAGAVESPTATVAAAAPRPATPAPAPAAKVQVESPIEPVVAEADVEIALERLEEPSVVASSEAPIETDTGAAGEEPAEVAVSLKADPSDYTVAADSSIEVQAVETLGHYADWLEIRTQRLRDINGYAFGRHVLLGSRLNLEFGGVSKQEFEARRLAYHRDLQAAFFQQHQITDTLAHVVRPGESVWILANRRYNVPVWLLRQYNPELNLEQVRPGTRVVFPKLISQSRG